MSLEKYLFHRVNVVDIYKNKYSKYYVDAYESATDNGDTNEESIGIISSKNAKNGTWLDASEIKSIELAE